MKKFLALVLALVMTMSLVTISAGAEFTDADEINYDEAVEVMTAVKVVDGLTDGSFNPQGGLSRGAAAKIICNMILGPTTAGALTADAAPYSDVAADSVFAGYIAYCAKEGIISGYADGTFRPAAPLTGYAFMKMLLGALGYDPAIEGYTGANWSINVAKQALALGLEDGLKGDFVGAKALNREEALLYAFNTMKATMVSYDTKSTIKVGDIEITTDADAKDVANKDFSYVVGDGTYPATGTMQFCEKYFKNLKLTVAPNALGQPANTWKIKNDKVGTYTSEAPVVAYTASTKVAVVKADLEGFEYAAGLKYTLNGDVQSTIANYDDIAAITANGKAVEVYATDGVIDVVAAVSTDVAQVVSVNKTKETFTISYNSGKTLVVDEDSDFYGLYADVAKDDYLAVVANNDNDVLDLYVPETVTGKITYVNSTAATGANTKATIDGVTYTTNEAQTLFSGKLAQDSVLYMNEYGYVILVDAVEAPAAEYIFVTNYWSETSAIYGGTTKYFVKGVLVDGTVTTMEVINAPGKSTGNAIDPTYFAANTYSTTAAEGKAVAFGANGDDTADFTGDFGTNVFAYDESDSKSGLYQLTFAADADVVGGDVGTMVESVAALNKNANSIAGSNAGYYMTPGVQFVYVSGTGDDVKASVGGKAGLTAGTTYTAVVELVDDVERITAVFVASASVNSDDTIYVSEKLGTVKYVDPNGNTQNGYQVTYWAKGATEPATMVLKDNDGVGFYTLATYGEAYDSTAHGTEYTNKIENDAVTSMYNGYAMVGSEFNLNNAAIIDTTDNGIDSVEALEAAVNADDQTVYVSFLYNNLDSNKVEAVYVQAVKSTDAGLKSVSINGTAADVKDSFGLCTPVEIVKGTALTVAVELSDNTASYAISWSSDTGTYAWDAEGAFANGTSAASATADKVGALQIVVTAKDGNTATYYVTFKAVNA